MALRSSSALVPTALLGMVLLVANAGSAWAQNSEIIQTFPIGEPQPVPRQAVQLHVNAAAGSDTTGDGTQLRPFRTISHALRVAQPNTIIVLAAGEYSQETGETFPLQLKPGVTIQGMLAPGRTPAVIRGTGPYTSTGRGLMQVTILAVDRSGLANVTVTNPNGRGHGVVVEAGSPVIRENTFANSGYVGAYVLGAGTPVFERNYFINNGEAGLVIEGNSQAQVDSNVFENTGTGIRVAPGAAPQIRNNRVVQNQDGIVLQPSAQPILQNNWIAENHRNGLVEFRAEATQQVLSASPPVVPFGSPLSAASTVRPEPESAAALLPPSDPSPFAAEDVSTENLGAAPVAPGAVEAPAAPAVEAATPAEGATVPVLTVPPPTSAVASQTAAPVAEAPPSAAVAQPDTLPLQVEASPIPPASSPTSPVSVAPPQRSASGSSQLQEPSATPPVTEPAPDPASEVDHSLALATPAPEAAVTSAPLERRSSNARAIRLPNVGPNVGTEAPASREPVAAVAPADAGVARSTTAAGPVESAPLLDPPQIAASGTAPAASAEAAPQPTQLQRILQNRQARTAAQSTPTISESIPLQVIPPPTTAPTAAIPDPTLAAYLPPAPDAAPPVNTLAANNLPTLPLPDPANSQLLQVPSSNIPLGNGGGDLPTVLISSNPNDGPPPPPTHATILGLNYRVLVPASDEAAQSRVRQIVPDAFRVRVNGTVMMQAGAFEDEATADAIARDLINQGLDARVERR